MVEYESTHKNDDISEGGEPLSDPAKIISTITKLFSRRRRTRGERPWDNGKKFKDFGTIISLLILTK